MQMLKGLKILLLGLAVIYVAGCASTGGSGTDSGDGTGADGSGGDTQTAEATAAADRARVQAEEAEMEAQRMVDEQGRLLSITTFYFDFDQSVIKPEARAALEAHARNLTETGGSLVLEGHADERGTREYNLALGERRGESIARYLSALGVSSARMETVSYGEERPSSLGHDDSSWSLNRRVELRYE